MANCNIENIKRLIKELRSNIQHDIKRAAIKVSKAIENYQYAIDSFKPV